VSEVSASFEARNRLVETPQLDLIGPDNRHALAAEALPESPSRCPEARSSEAGA